MQKKRQKIHVSSCLCIYVCTQLVVGVGVCVCVHAQTHASGQELLCGIATGEAWSIKLVSTEHPLGLAFLSSEV